MAGLKKKNMNSELAWDLGPSHRCVYSTKDDLVSEHQKRSRWLAQWSHVKQWHFPRKQVHGDHIIDLDQQVNDLPCDALISSRSNVGLGVWGSDCPGLAIVTEDTMAIAHCGWRGTASSLPSKLVERLKQKSTSPVQHWHAVIGPGICPNCYQVDQPVLTAHPWPDSCLNHQNGEHAQLDLKLAIKKQLLFAGLTQVFTSPICTAEHPNLHSYRHQGRGPNQLLILMPHSVQH
jgi:YfiH family protein